MNFQAPFPWFGGKRRVASKVWNAFGDVPNYVEPFFGSGAVLLNRPHVPRCETVNDLDCYVANFWRALAAAPDEIAAWADWPVNEADLHARHLWLVEQYGAGFRELVRTNPHFFDAQIAGWWVWGISQWIGSGWCAKPEWEGRALAGRAARGIHAETVAGRLPDLGGNSGTNGKGVNASGLSARVAGKNLWLKRPSLRRGGTGVQRVNLLPQKHPQMKRGLGSGILRGVTTRQLWQQKPNLSSHSGRGVQSETISDNLLAYMSALADRMRRVRVCCGDWRRVLGPSPTTCIGITAVFLDPPYSQSAGRDAVYNTDDFAVAQAVARWAAENGDNPKPRIALCGYAGEHRMPRGWEEVSWKANGGYGNQSRGRGFENARKERIWFSPHCLPVKGAQA